MKKLGFGLMRLPSLDPNDSSKIDVEQTKRMVDTFIERGFTYFDTAWMYCKFRSEHVAKEALVDRYPRDSYTLATKLHAAFLKCEEDKERIFNEQLAKTGVDYFDYYLIHDIESTNYDTYNKYDCFNWIQEKKRAGLVRRVGFSFHDTAEFLDRVLTEHPEMEFVQLQINYLDWESEKVQSRKCYEVARKHGKPIIIMEPVKGGKLANVPEAAKNLLKSHDPDASVPSWAIRFAAGLEGVVVVLSGMSNMEQLLDNTSYMSEFKPLSEDEKKLLFRVADIINGKGEIPCTACSYCTDGCPVNIPIPKYISLYNAACANANDPAPRADYDAVAVGAGKASDCIGCGQCEGVCPQHLPIIEHLKKIADHFE